MNESLVIEKKVTASIPSKYGEFDLSLFTTNQDTKEHLALIYGSVAQSENILVRIHSECFTGDILGSLRCDCGEQLQLSMSQIALEGKGIIIYLRQEGRGIGLVEKLKSYNLQDLGKDTIDANLALGHEIDTRSYEIAALILKELQIKSIRLLTNNPKKIEALSNYNLNINERIPIKGTISSYNAFYLLTKIKKMNHLSHENEMRELLEKCQSVKRLKPQVTLSYAQSLDGAISTQEKKRILLSSKDSLIMTHQLRSQHDAILVGIGTILNDDPLLTVRYAEGDDPLPVILDSKLSINLNARILQNKNRPIIFTTKLADSDKKKQLLNIGITIFETDTNFEKRINIESMLEKLYQLGVKSLMVEGGQEIMTSFIKENCVDKVVITIAPYFIGGLSVLSKELTSLPEFPKLKNIIQYKLGNDLIIKADVAKMGFENCVC